MRIWQLSLMAAGIGFLCFVGGMMLAQTGPTDTPAALSPRFAGMERALKAANARTEKMERAVDALAERVNRLEPTVAELRNREPVPQQGSGAVDARLVALEPRVSELAERVPKVADAVVTLAQQMYNARERLSALEQTVNRLRMSDAPGQRSVDSANPAAPAGKAAWRQMRRGMTTEHVRALLGEPQRVSAQLMITYWHYSASGVLGPYVMFDSKTMTVDGWTEP